MYRNGRYRLGGASRLSTSTGKSKNDKMTASSVGPITSTPNEPIPGPSNVLTERTNKARNNQSPDRKTTSTTSKSSNVPSDDSPVIPASQFIEPSRYISQRSVRMRSQLSAITQQTPLTYFESVLKACGVQFTARNTDISYTLNCDHLTFVSNLRKEFKSHQSYPENIQDFLSGLLDMMKNQTQLIKLLSGCIIYLPNSDITKPSQESIMNDLLLVDFLQTEIIEILLNKIKVLSVQNNNASNMEIDLILAQLKFVDHLTNGDMVCDKMFEILDLATNDARQTIIRSLEDIVDLTRHNDVVKKLMELLPNDADLLTAGTIDTFGNMCLTSASYENICRKIIRYIKSDAPIELLPCFTKFILRFNNQSVESLPDIIENLRSCLKWPNTDLPTTKITINKNQNEVFGCISRSLIRSKQLFDVWLKRIQAINERHKPIDLIILLMMMTINDERSNYIENIIRRKLRADIIQVKLLEETVRLYPTILLEYSKILFELLDAFVRDKNQRISNFASAAFRIVFGIDNCDRKVLLSKLVGFVCERHTQAILSADGGNSAASSIPHMDLTTNALMILTEINRKYPIEMQNNALQILRVLDVCNEFTLSQFRTIIDILCSLAYTEPPCDLLKDHIDMLVKKQVSSSIRTVRNRGIIGLVRVVDHMIWERKRNDATATDTDDLESSYSGIEDLPTEAPKAAANYIDLLITSAQTCPNHLALCFDELATVFLLRNQNGRCINRPFLIWFSDLIAKYFESNFVVVELPESSSNLPLEFGRSLNPPDELETNDSEGKVSIAINIAGNVLNPSSNKLASITILAPLVNLMRILYSRRHGDLTLIDAVLGAAIVLPKIMSPNNENVDIFDELDDDSARQVLDTYFYTVNYWRECISAFVSQNCPMIRTKVLTRFTEIIELEAKIKEIMLTAPDDYVPPVFQFITEKISGNGVKFKRPAVPVKKTAAKRKKTAEKSAISQMPASATNEDATMIDLTGQVSIRGDAANRKKVDRTTNFDLTTVPNEYYRQIDPDVMILFDENLILQFPLPKEKIGQALGVLEFKFLMEDLTIKIESIYGVQKFGANSNCCNQNIPFPAHFIADTVQLLPKILLFYNQLANQLKIIIDQSEAIDFDDMILYSDETNYIKICFGLCLRLLSALYTWPGFNDDSNQEMLIDSLNAIIGDTPIQTTAKRTVNELALIAIKNITGNADIVMDLQTAVYMFHLSRTLAKYAVADDICESHPENTVILCKQFLSKTWHSFDGNEVRGAECNLLLDELLKGYFHDAKFSFIKRNVEWTMQEIKDLSGKKGILKTFPCFKESNFALLYRVVYLSLIEALQRKLDKSVQSVGQLKIWENSCHIINQLLEIAKTINLSRVFSLFLKNTHAYLKLFLQHGMPIIETTFRKNVERVSEFLRNLQNSTRFLHTLCCHSKSIKNSAIIVQIPLLRETIAQLVYKVKGALAANKCSSATVFWMGNLKNKNLYGEELLSQTTSITRSSASVDDDENELPNDDDDNENDVTAERQKSNGKRTKRKLYQKNSSELENADDSNEDTADSSRSRCF